MKNTNKKRIRFLGGIGLGIGILVFVYITVSTSFNRVYELLLEKDLRQTTHVSQYVTKLIETELENVVGDLQVSQQLILRKRNQDPVQLVEQLKELRIKLRFEKIAVCDLKGNAIDWEGKNLRIEQPDMLQAAAAGQNYIASVVNESDAILLAVPVMREQEPVAVLCGHYQVERIAETIELDANSPHYFQIVDDSGRYISDANNVNSFARGENIWDEIKKYQLSDGITAEDIRRDMEEGRSGTFHFTYHGAGRYVTYEPLGINNWYAFSVLTEDYVTGYVREIENLFSLLLWGILACVLAALAFIGQSVYRTTALVKEQNAKLSSRNSLLFMVLEHTNDIPFEMNLAKRTVTLYRIGEQEQAEVKDLEEYFPDRLLEKQMIERDSYDTYKRIWNNMTNMKSMEPEIIRIQINGKWVWNKVYYKNVDQDQIVGFLENYNEQVRQYKMMEEIDRKSRLDPLTALYNRAYFKQEVDRAIEKYGFSPKTCYSALFLMDLDYFKTANDTLGHIMGDEILKESALAMRSAIRSTDICGRLGGDEFVLFIADAKDLNAIGVCARKLNEAVRRTYGIGDRQVSISASIGVAVLTSEKTFEELYQLADVALYRVKEAGRNGFYIISKDTEKEEAHHEAEMENQK